MNKLRRKNLQSIIDRLDELKSDLEELMYEEEEYRDNMPENLQYSDRYAETEAACDNLNDAVNGIEEVVSSIENAIE